PLSRILEKLSNMSEYEREETFDLSLQEDDKVIELGEARELLDENTSILR
ncbi:unnamed protein product, partial [Brassica oleracea]